MTLDVHPISLAKAAHIAVRQKAPRAWLALFTAIACVHVHGTIHIDPALRWAVIACLIGGLTLNGHLARALQILGGAILVGVLIVDWILFANHGYLITYFALFFAVCAVTRTDFWQHGEWFTRIMLGLLMAAALLHKLFSPYFLGGNLIGEMLLTGQYYTRLLNRLQDGLVEIVTQSRLAQQQLLDGYDLQASGVTVDLPEISLFLMFVIYAMTFGSLLAQALVEVALIWRRWFGIWLHRFIFAFSLTVYSLTPEHIFLSMNLMMGYALTDDRASSMRLPYVIAIVYLLSVHLIGFRPLIFR